jgi:tetratricopeptide (TPR) repeat protein
MMRAALIFILTAGLTGSAAAQSKDARLPENTIDCKQFKKTGSQEWMEVETAVFNLGKISDINLTNQPVRPRSFKFGGIDLYPVLEGKCGAAVYFAQGKTDHAKGDYDSALANFDRAIHLDPNNAEAYDSRGEVYASKGDYARAIADYNEALRLDLRLESAANHRTIAAEKLAQESGSDIAAEAKIRLAEAVAAPEKEPEPNRTELASAKGLEQTDGNEQSSRDRAAAATSDSGASSKSQPESGPHHDARAQKSKMRRRHSVSGARRLYDDLARMFRN